MALNIKKEFGNSRQRTPDITSLVYGKVPPQAPKIEEAVLGVLMLEKDRIDDVISILPSEECFYVDAHQKIYAAILRLIKKGTPVDMLTVIEDLRQNNELEIVGGHSFIANLTREVVTGAHIEAHARIILEKFMQREIIRINGSSVGDAYEDRADAFDLLDKLEAELYQLRQHTIKREVTHIKNIAFETVTEAETQRQKKIVFTGVPTGSQDMDELTKGWQPTDLIILAARPAVGKTAFALNVAMNAALYNNRGQYPVAFFSLEMTQKKLFQRMIASSSGLLFEKVQTPYMLTDEEFMVYVEHSKRLSEAPIFFDDTPALTMPELRAKARKLKRKQGIKMIIIDYLQLMKGDSGQSWNRENEISQISSSLKLLAKELEIPIIALCQLNRTVESRLVRTYKLSDLRESGAIEQDADMVMFLHVPTKDDFKATKETALHSAGVFIEKHRNGKCDKVVYAFDKDIQRWSEYKADLFKKKEKTEKVVPSQAELPTIKDDLPF